MENQITRLAAIGLFSILGVGLIGFSIYTTNLENQNTANPQILGASTDTDINRESDNACQLYREYLAVQNEAEIIAETELEYSSYISQTMRPILDNYKLNYGVTEEELNQLIDSEGQGC